MSCRSLIVITHEPNLALEYLQEHCAHMHIVSLLKEGSFLSEDAQKAIEKAYLASDEERMIVVGGSEISEVVQNKLLKILEEPPLGVHFCLVVPTKAILLHTIRSRLHIVKLTKSEDRFVDMGSLDLSTLHLQMVYDTIQAHKRSDSVTVRKLIEAIAKEVMQSDLYRIDKGVLKLFENAIKALDKGSIPSFVLTAVLLKLLAKKRR